MATVAFVEWPDGLKTEDAEWGVRHQGKLGF
jgi:hypothetical protein